jgi:hypothetical protein
VSSTLGFHILAQVPLLDFLYPPTSPVRQSLEELSALLMLHPRQHSRVFFGFRAFGQVLCHTMCTSYLFVCNHKCLNAFRDTSLRIASRGNDNALSPSSAWLLFRQSLTGISELEYRVQFVLDQWPNNLFVLADKRQSQLIKSQTTDDFLGASNCCLRQYDSVKIKNMACEISLSQNISLREAVLSDDFVALLGDAADMVDMNNAVCENDHAANKHSTREGRDGCRTVDETLFSFVIYMRVYGAFVFS